MASLCHPWFTTTNRSYRFPIFETSATALCGTTGNIEYNSCGQITYMYIFNIFIYMPGIWHVVFFSLLSLPLTLRKSLYVNYGELNNFPSVYYSHAQYIKDKICSLQLWWKPRAFCLPTQTKPLFKFWHHPKRKKPSDLHAFSWKNMRHTATPQHCHTLSTDKSCQWYTLPGTEYVAQLTLHNLWSKGSGHSPILDRGPGPE